MKRIGILGGSFDPVHNAHVAMANAALARIPLDKVLVMPAPRPPHKAGETMSPYALRRRMASLAIAGQAGLELSLLEEESSGASYTVDLLRRYRSRHGDELYLILGADSVQDLPTWKEPSAILNLATLVVFPRTGFGSAVPVRGNASVVLFEEPIIDISSTAIRESVHAGRSIEGVVPPSVREFILDNSLYA
jgi:nicotinate-nucleotide adenylyltransferase